MKEKKLKDNLTHRVITMLDRREVEFLDKLGKDSLFSTGHKLSYNEILKGLVDTAIDAGLSGEGIDSEAGFKDKLLKQIKGLMRQEEQAKTNEGAK